MGNMTADLRVSKGGREVFLHVKRVATDIDNRVPGTRGSPRLRLGMVPRPWLIRVLELGGHRSSNAAFGGGGDGLRHASVGDELKVTDHDGSDLAESACEAPHDGRRVVLHIGMPDGFIDHTPRMRKRLTEPSPNSSPGQKTRSGGQQ